MLDRLNNSWFLKHKKVILIAFIVLLSPLILTVSNILFEFIYNLGKITGTNLRNIAEVVCKML